MLIKVDDLSNPATRSVLALHAADLQSKIPESSFVLDVTSLQKPDVTVFSVWDSDEDLLGCGAIKELSPTTGEIKSMRTVSTHLRKGVGRAIVKHIIDVARERGYEWLGLETGMEDFYMGARTLYLSMGFEFCGPFADYVHTGQNCFMMLKL